MAFGRKIDYCIEFFLLAECKNGLSVSYISEDKSKITLACRIKSIKIACIGQSVNTYQSVVGVLALHIINEIAADKSGSAGNKNIFHKKSPLEIVIDIIHYIF